MVFKNKKGWVDILFIALLLIFSFALINMFIGNSFDSINSQFQEQEALSNQSKEMIEGLNNRYSTIVDGSFALILVSLLILCLFMAYNSVQQPVFKVIVIVFLIIMTVVSILLGSFYTELVETSTVLNTFSNYPFANWVLNNFGVVTLVFAASMLAMIGFGGRRL